MIFSESKVITTVTVEVPLTEDDIATIVISGLEGGINYWAALDIKQEGWENRPDKTSLSEWATKMLLEGKSLTFFDAEDEDEEAWCLTLDKLIKGYKTNVKKRPHDTSIEEGDAFTFDAIFQYALFDDMVYG